MDKNVLIVARCFFLSLMAAPIILAFSVCEKGEAKPAYTHTETGSTVTKEILPPKITLAEDVILCAGEKHKISEYVLNLENGELCDGEKLLDTKGLGEKTEKIAVRDGKGNISHFDFVYTLFDNIPPVIKVLTPITTVQKNNTPDLSSAVKVTDNSGEKITPVISGDYDLSVCGKYNLICTAADSSGNSSKAELQLWVYTLNPAPGEYTPEPLDKINITNYHLPYVINVYREDNTVVVYGPDDNGNFKSPVKVFIASCGADENTPIGQFETTAKYRWAKLIGPTYGQYSTRIGPKKMGILFHSVPYIEEDPSTLEYWLYNRLGTKDSLGCVRLTVEEAKWIFDNCPVGVNVTITTDPPPKGIVRPKAPHIPEDSPYKGWDPTDPAPENPWKNPPPENPPEIPPEIPSGEEENKDRESESEE